MSGDVDTVAIRAWCDAHEPARNGTGYAVWLFGVLDALEVAREELRGAEGEAAVWKHDCEQAWINYRSEQGRANHAEERMVMATQAALRMEARSLAALDGLCNGHERHDCLCADTRRSLTDRSTP